MIRHEASLLASSVFLVIVYSLLMMTHTMVLPSRGPLADTLNLITSLRSPAIAATLLYSSLRSVASLFLNLTEFLKAWEPWSGLLILAVARVVNRVWRSLSAPGTQSALVIT
jgi:hypothetical protein